MKEKKIFRKYKNCEVKHEKPQSVIYQKASRKAVLLSAIITAALLFLIFYVNLFAVNLRSGNFWGLIVFACILFFGLKALFMAAQGSKDKLNFSPEEQKAVLHAFKREIRIPVVIAVVGVICSILGAQMFHAKRYASILNVEDSVFEEDLAETLSTDSIALMDTYSARMLGDREIGSLSNVVSQFDVSDDYTQIDKNGKPLKVSALEYVGFFKWVNNKKDGIPGYVTVNPVTMSADYQQIEEGMKYVPSAYFGQNLFRHIRFRYPTALLGTPHFEIDEEGAPFYVCPVYKKTIMVFGGTTVKGAVIVNPVDGSMNYYAVDEVPRWADLVFEGDLLCQQYNWYGTLNQGFINSVIGKKGCKRVTQYYSGEEGEIENTSDAVPANDYGYVAKDGDIWIYTGITSVNGDSSNIGFIMANERTGETHYYGVAGADEKSAMAAAEGEVQEKRYQASFPSLINVDGQPTYIMVLKDASGLVKLYAAVNVEQYNLVTTAASQAECIQKYRMLIGTGQLSEEDAKPEEQEKPEPNENTPVLEVTEEKDIQIADIKYIDIDGNTYVYLIDQEQNLYRQKAALNENLLLLQAGDRIHIGCNGRELIRFETIE